MARPRLRRALSALLAAGAAALAAWAALPATQAGETRTGTLNVVWQTRGTRNALAAVNVFLVDDRGRATLLDASPAELAPLGGLLHVTGRRVTITGDLRLPARGAPVLRVRSIRAADGIRAAISYRVQQGPRAYVVLLCRFPDLAATDPHPASTYQQWMGSSYPGLDDYWRENSGGRISFTSTVVGPFVMPKPSSAYLDGGAADLGALAVDCTHAADATVDFSQFAGVVMQFNSQLDDFSWGGGWTLALDGQTRSVATAWMASWATQATYAHETGHTLGLPHSSGPYGATYDSRWDVMSTGGGKDAALGTVVATHTIAFHKDLLGWIPEDRKLLLGTPGTMTVDLTRSEVPGPTGYEIVQLPIAGNPRVFYTVEARRFAGYDRPASLPGEAVVLHKVDLDSAATPAKVVDVDGNGNPNDAGAMWTPGETFVDANAGIRVSVLSATADGFRVALTQGWSVVVDGDSVLVPGIMGTAYQGRLSAGDAGDGATWSVGGGALPPGVTVEVDGRIDGVPRTAGTWRFTVVVAGANGIGRRDLRMDVREPVLAEQAVLDQLLGQGTLTAEQVRYLDFLGNDDGRLDVGDVRAWRIARGLPVGQ